LVAAPLRVQRRQGGGEYVSVAQSVQTVADVAGKPIQIRYVQGPVGVQSRNFSNERIYSVEWRPRYSLKDGIARTYAWVQAQVEARRASRRASPSTPTESRSSAR